MGVEAIKVKEASYKQDTKDKTVFYDLRGISNKNQLYKSTLEALKDLKGVGVINSDSQLDDLAANITKVSVLKEKPENITELILKYDRIVLEPTIIESKWYENQKAEVKKKLGTMINIVDKSSLELANKLVKRVDFIIVEFKDDTKIPLEIVLAEAQKSNCQVVMKVKDRQEGQIVFGVLECGADGIIVKINDLYQLYDIYEDVKKMNQKLTQNIIKLRVKRTFYAGMGERACIDFTTKLEKDEGVLLGSFSNGGLLACSETHPLPYMPTRPFRVNAGSLHSYALGKENRTWYLSDLEAGAQLLIVNTKGEARYGTVGRIKIERRPLLCIVAEKPNHEMVNLFMQADWHVRIFDAKGSPVNITNLKPGDEILGYSSQSGRHVGVKVDELIIEQ
ncbi:3-amino-4-hydroxybenzoic acid synthase [Orenia metallireducens]|jgi:3-amino-4-hydroxybenzoic acid synthase|uniref:3-amino-4-hydroxybenzoic acid synthase n=1 Tax=Orenia metallireducens TaxID=1413210 RepID=A0A285I6E3_9FIRM|nr:3-dehydroquinate synthase II [Orenia metallireducens]PRX23133.1 3-amino-4-hydroxybenzoic acid synthase [Orenia metallireducens]SNY42521.1 3-amino-4-hydroxybenzoic acid synthase [Orenia metallireducens]